MSGHQPVLLREVLEGLVLQANDPVIDATVGGGGHAAAMLESTGPVGRLLGLELDPRTFHTAQQSLAPYGQRCTLVQTNFRQLATVVAAQHFPPAAAVVIDLGLSSMTIDDPARGFSFQQDGPLDMRFDPEHQALTAADIINTWSDQELAELFMRYGEERAAVKIAQSVVAQRSNAPFHTTTELAHAIAKVIPRQGQRHPATKVFQALRIAVNDELGALQEVLPQAISVLRPGGRLAVISFHSLEDRLIKQWSRQAFRRGEVQIITKHAVAPTWAERQKNRRARSAKLRVFAKQNLASK